MPNSAIRNGQVKLGPTSVKPRNATTTRKPSSKTTNQNAAHNGARPSGKVYNPMHRRTA